MRLAVGGEQAAIELGQQAKLAQLLSQALPLFPRRLPEAGRAGRDPGGRSRLGVVEAALAGVAAQPHDIARQGLASTHRRLTLEVQPDDHPLTPPAIAGALSQLEE
jgi:hypothetical protein